jgi:hypothetical protein
MAFTSILKGNLVMHARLTTLYGLLSTLFSLLMAASLSADIVHFPFPGYTINQADSASIPTITPSTIKLTSAAATDQSRSIFYNSSQNISEFTASFRFHGVEGVFGGLIGRSYGGTFVLQNSSNGLDTFATGSFAGPEFGYGQHPPVFDHSVAVALEARSIDIVSSSTGLYTNGIVSGGSGRRPRRTLGLILDGNGG